MGGRRERAREGNIWGWARQKPGTRIQSISSTWVTETQALQQSPAASQGARQQEAKLRGELGPNPDTMTWDAGITSSILTTVPNTHPQQDSLGQFKNSSAVAFYKPICCIVRHLYNKLKTFLICFSWKFPFLTQVSNSQPRVIWPSMEHWLCLEIVCVCVCVLGKGRI